MTRMYLRKLFIGLLLFLAIDSQVFAGGNIKFPVSAIPKDLLSGAGSVMRMKTDVFTRINERQSVEKIHYAVTVLNKSGKMNGFFVQSYSRFSTVKDIRATVYNASGKKVKTIRQDQINDEAAGFYSTTLFTDIRVKYIDPEYDNYPYTVEYSCEIDYKGSLDLTDWYVIPRYDMAIQDESFSMIIPKNGDDLLAVHYYLNKKNIPFKKKVDHGRTIYSLHMSNLKAVHREDFSPKLQQITPTVYFAPLNFSIGGYKGSSRTWQNFGSFIHQLNKGRDALSEATKQKIRKISNAQDNFNDRVKAIYHYMQNKVRYVEIVKGISAWQPMKAETVDKVSYGDCKALANYMKSLLEAAGIKSYITLVDAGANAMPMITAFPSNQFNHAIICVPHGKDTTWLECTDQHVPAGYIGSFTDDRNVLLIGNGAMVVAHTKVYNASENSVHSNTTVNVAPNGDCKMLVKSRYSGMFYDRMLPLELADAQRQKAQLLKIIHLPTFQLTHYSFSEERKALPVVCATMNVNVPNYGTPLGNLLLLKLFPFNQGSDNGFRSKNRQSDILIRRSYSHIDTLVFKLPQGFAVAKMPKPTNIVTKFASCNFSDSKQGNTVTVIRKLIVKKGTYPPSDNNAFSNFFNEVDNLDGSRLILKQR